MESLQVNLYLSVLWSGGGHPELQMFDPFLSGWRGSFKPVPPNKSSPYYYCQQPQPTLFYFPRSSLEFGIRSKNHRPTKLQDTRTLICNSLIGPCLKWWWNPVPAVFGDFRRKMIILLKTRPIYHKRKFLPESQIWSSIEPCATKHMLYTIQANTPQMLIHNLLAHFRHSWQTQTCWWMIFQVRVGEWESSYWSNRR